MAKFSDLVKGFRSNVRDGIPSTLTFDGYHIHLTSKDRRGYVGIAERPKAKPKGGS